MKVLLVWMNVWTTAYANAGVDNFSQWLIAVQLQNIKSSCKWWAQMIRQIHYMWSYLIICGHIKNVIFFWDPNIRKHWYWQLLYEFYKQILTHQESSVILGLCCRNMLRVEHKIFSWWAYVIVCIWGATGLFIVQTSLSIAAFTDEENAVPHQKLNVHIHSFAALTLWGLYTALINLKETVLTVLTSSQTWNWTFLFFDFPAFTLKFGHIVGPKLPTILEQNLHVITPVHRWESMRKLSLP